MSRNVLKLKSNLLCILSNLSYICNRFVKIIVTKHMFCVCFFFSSFSSFLGTKTQTKRAARRAYYIETRIVVLHIFALTNVGLVPVNKIWDNQVLIRACNAMTIINWDCLVFSCTFVIGYDNRIVALKERNRNATSPICSALTSILIRYPEK